MSKSARQLVQTDLLLGLSDVPVGSAPAGQISGDPAAVEVQPSTKVEVEILRKVTQISPRLPADLSDRGAALEELRERHDRECPHCTRVRGHTQTVFGEGNPEADIFFVGEAPGETEDKCGRPFVGRAGQKLDEMIQAMGLRRADCYIANVLKSRPPDNRTPLASEIDLCGPYLVEQILIVNPKILVPLGGPATKLILKVEEGITKLRGKWAAWNPPASSGRPAIAVMPTFHPAYLLRNYTVETRAAVWSDLKAVVQRLSQH